jgi:predicted nucleotidyltransferase
MLNLIESRRQKIVALCRHFQVKRLDVFGSAARDDYDQGASDIDLLVEFDQVAAASLFDAYFGLREKLTELLACPIDLVMVSAVRNPYVKQSIESDRALIYAA